MQIDPHNQLTSYLQADQSAWILFLPRKSIPRPKKPKLDTNIVKTVKIVHRESSMIFGPFWMIVALCALY